MSKEIVVRQTPRDDRGGPAGSQQLERVPAGVGAMLRERFEASDEESCRHVGLADTARDELAARAQDSVKTCSISLPPFGPRDGTAATQCSGASNSGRLCEFGA